MDPFDVEVNRFLSQCSALLPTGITYDWRPFLRALSEGNLAINGVNRLRVDEFPDTRGMQSYITKHGNSKPSAIREIPKEPGTGSFEYSLYIPEWSHPEFDPGLSKFFTGEIRHISNRDPIHRIYPALRAADQLRQPTEWAIRFGIHPDETGGRSRLSPTLSHTRNPFEHFANQVSLLSGDSKRRLFEQSRNAAAMADQPAPSDPYYVDLNVLETILAEQGAMSGDELKQRLQQMLVAYEFPMESTNLEASVKALNEQSPDTYKFHQSYLEAALSDQDYQRLLFRDMTSDELVEGTFLSLTDPFQCDLDNEIHNLFQRYHWADTDWRGNRAADPRWLYNLEGERHEWNARRNDVVWAAMEPALKFASHVITSKHEIFRQLSDMTLRQAVPPEEDNRPGPNEDTLYRFLPQQEPGLKGTPPGVAELHQAGFDWIKAVHAVLERTLVFDLYSGWLDTTPVVGDPPEIAHESKGYSYGTTRMLMAGASSKIVIYVAPEMVWPLLVSQYNGSEKLVTSFTLASSLLHELAHAIIQAQVLLTHSRDLALAMGYDEWTANQLGRMYNVISNVSHPYYNGEPFHPRDFSCECGFVFERAVFGLPTFCLNQNNYTEHSRHINSLAFVAAQTHWPFPGTESNEAAQPIKGASLPATDYVMPVPISHMAKFFRKNFWLTDVANFGAHALKMIPGRLAFKTLMMSTNLVETRSQAAFGVWQYDFILAVMVLLRANEHFTLSDYLMRSVWFALTPGYFLDRWNWDWPRWKVAWMKDLDNALNVVNQNCSDGQYLISHLTANQQVLNNAYQDYIVRRQQTGGHIFSGPQWFAELQRRGTEMFRRGGTMMRSLQDLYIEFITGVRYMQRMIFDYFNHYPDARLHTVDHVGVIHNEWETLPVMKNAYMRLYNDRVKVITVLQNIQAMVGFPQLSAIKADYDELEKMFQFVHNLLDDLVKMMEVPPAPDSDDVTWKKRFASVPSSYWKSALDRVQSLAQKEYLRADPRVRQTFDTSMELVRNGLSWDASIAPFITPDDDDLQVDEIQISSPSPLPPPSASVSEFIPPSGGQVPPMSPIMTFNNNPPPPSAQGIVFGQPSQLGAIPPRRDDPPPGNASAAPFQIWAAAPGFGAASNQRGAQGLAQTPFGQGGPANVPPGTGGSTIFQPHGTSILFPAAGAAPFTLTEDVDYDQESRTITEQGVSGQSFTTNEGYRDRGPVFEEDGSEGASPRPPAEGVHGIPIYGPVLPPPATPPVPILNPPNPLLSVEQQLGLAPQTPFEFSFFLPPSTFQLQPNSPQPNAPVAPMYPADQSSNQGFSNQGFSNQGFRSQMPGVLISDPSWAAAPVTAPDDGPENSSARNLSFDMNPSLNN
ncbi:hypothetical protein F5B19DRAFT_228575 [Rostrohypoxylon terebratum]|nr:hypothetical protein F5B19DRAFT_228575 [Rostrohypoxylon terebratum]